MAACTHGSFRFLALPEGQRLTQSWAGVIDMSSRGDFIALRGNTPGVVALAAQALLAAQTLEDFVTVPFTPLRKGN